MNILEILLSFSLGLITYAACHWFNRNNDAERELAKLNEMYERSLERLTQAEREVEALRQELETRRRVPRTHS